jgi:uncharacterized ferritin-like protein (DUF455 family)
MAKKRHFPDTIKILGRDFKVVFTDEDISVNGKSAAAFVCFDSKEVQVRDSLTPDTKLIALLHEAAHIGLDVSGLDQVFSDEIVEAICQTMANTYFDFLKSVGVVKLD